MEKIIGKRRPVFNRYWISTTGREINELRLEMATSQPLYCTKNCTIHKIKLLLLSILQFRSSDHYILFNPNNIDHYHHVSHVTLSLYYNLNKNLHFLASFLILQHSQQLYRYFQRLGSNTFPNLNATIEINRKGRINTWNRFENWKQR